MWYFKTEAVLNIVERDLKEDFRTGLRYFAKRNETKWYFVKWYFAKRYFAKRYFAKHRP